MKRLLLLLLIPNLADAKCARPIIGSEIVSTRDTHIPADGGVLIAAGHTDEANASPKFDDPTDVEWTANGKKLDRTVLAPGLAVLKGGGNFTIKSKSGAALGTFTHDGKQASLAAPKIASAKVVTSREVRWQTTTGTVTLKSAAPAEAVAIIVYDADKAISFGRLADTHDKDLSIVIYQEGGHCGIGIPGQGTLLLSQKVTFAYVDAFGRVSPKSAAVTVQ
ncbi:MAG: hypothetical protein QM831_12445 [Kofleriaceae bacterium]